MNDFFSGLTIFPRKGGTNSNHLLRMEDRDGNQKNKQSKEKNIVAVPAESDHDSCTVVSEDTHSLSMISPNPSFEQEEEEAKKLHHNIYHCSVQSYRNQTDDDDKDTTKNLSLPYTVEDHAEYLHLHLNDDIGQEFCDVRHFLVQLCRSINWRKCMLVLKRLLYTSMEKKDQYRKQSIKRKIN